MEKSRTTAEAESYEKAVEQAIEYRKAGGNKSMAVVDRHRVVIVPNATRYRHIVELVDA